MLAGERLVGRVEMHSVKAITLHFWIATIGILLYIVAIYAAGLTQGLMFRAFDESGRLAYPDFIETTVRLIPMYWVRVLGGVLYIAGMILCGVNALMTWRTGPARYAEPVHEAARALDPHRLRRDRQKSSHGASSIRKRRIISSENIADVRRTMARSPPKNRCLVPSRPSRSATAKQTVPTGFSAVPPSGPAIPVTDAARSAPNRASAPLAISREVSSDTAPNRPRVSGATPSNSCFAESE